MLAVTDRITMMTPARPRVNFISTISVSKTPLVLRLRLEKIVYLPSVTVT